MTKCFHRFTERSEYGVDGAAWICCLCGKPAEQFSDLARETTNAEIEGLKKVPFLSWICAVCGSPTSSMDDSIDTGTALLCKHCGCQTVVELHQREGYKARHDMELQNRELLEALRKIHRVATVHDLDPELASKIRDISRVAAKYLDQDAGKFAEGI